MLFNSASKPHARVCKPWVESTQNYETVRRRAYRVEALDKQQLCDIEIQSEEYKRLVVFFRERLG